MECINNYETLLGACKNSMRNGIREAYGVIGAYIW